MSEESHATLREDRKCPMEMPDFLQERRPLFLALLDVFRKYLIIRAF